MEVEKIATFAGVLVSLCLTYFPGIQGWYSNLNGSQKAYVYIGILAVGTVLVALKACAPLNISFIPSVACSSWDYYVDLFISASIAGTATYVTTKSLN